MKITVKLFATLRESRQKIIELNVPKGATPYDIADILNIDPHDIAIIMINGRSENINKTLNDNDVLALFPPLGGG